MGWRKCASCNRDVVSALTVLSVTGDMGVGKSCLLHQFTEKKCEYFNYNVYSNWYASSLFPAFLLPSCMSLMWCLSPCVWVSVVLGQIFVWTPADVETNGWCSNGKTAASVSPTCDEREDYVCFYSFSRTFWCGKNGISCLKVACFQYWCSLNTSSWSFFSAFKHLKQKKGFIFLWLFADLSSTAILCSCSSSWRLDCPVWWCLRLTAVRLNCSDFSCMLPWLIKNYLHFFLLCVALEFAAAIICVISHGAQAQWISL